MNKKLTKLALLASLALSGAAQAALVDRGGGLIYDTALDVTWLQDANAALGSIYDKADGIIDGRMTWQNAVDWAANLSYFDSIRNVTYDDWRLPFIVDTGIRGCDNASSGTDCGFNVQTTSGSTVYSEMASLFYDTLGNKGLLSPTGAYQTDSGLKNAGPFQNFKSFVYWSGTEFAPPDRTFAWVFDTYDGSQTYGNKVASYHALAVRPGDVAAVPEADIWAMLLAGLGLVGAVTRRRLG